MLTRAPRRRDALRVIQHAADHIQLPWLCPALAASNPVKHSRRTTTTTTTTTTRTATASSRPTPSLPRSTAVSPQQSRRLASAAPVNDERDSGDDYLPFAYDRHGPSFYHADALPQYDLSTILMMDHTTAQPIERAPTHAHGEVRGNALEIEAMLEACLQVQRWERAFAILAQLRRLYSTNPVKLQSAYNRVLEAMVFDLVWNRNEQNRSRINKWIEVDMRAAGLDPNAQTFALKIKAALATLDGSRRDRTVRRYWQMAQDYQLENQVASLRSILADSDLGKLTEICPLDITIDGQADAPPLDVEPNTTRDPGGTSGMSSVRETEQKGLGLHALRQALALFSSPSDPPSTRPPEEDPRQLEQVLERRQKRLEQDSMQSAMERWKIEHEKRVKMGVSGNLTQGRIGALLWQWHQSVQDQLVLELGRVEQAEAALKKTPADRNRCEYGPFLRLLPPPTMAALTALAVMQAMSKSGVASPMRVARLVTEVGRAVESEVDAQRRKDQRAMAKTKTAAGGTPAAPSDPAPPSAEPRATATPLHDSRIHRRGRQWTIAITAKVGAVLCEMLFEAAKIPVPPRAAGPGPAASAAAAGQAVFQRQMIYQNGRKVGTVILHDVVRAILVKEPPADMIAKQMPMISKPRPWSGYATGGYLESRQPVLRVKFDDVAQRDYAQAAAARGDLDQMFAGLDVLGSTPWKVNPHVFDVMLKAWNSGEAIANLPPVDKVFPDVPKPADDAPAIDKWRYYSKMRARDNEQGGLHSNRCFQNFQMEIARAYKDEVFYLPHNVDFRGRAYPIPPYLNQMGADNARGLLLFAHGRALGPDGLKWLQVHLANVFGYDKASLDGRARFAMDHLAEIRDAVDHPLDGRRWWLQAEDPWQCLAACHELVGALAVPDPATFVSHLPIHQDGTCNGLQHYAALGGDIAGARQVNLEPGDRPADVYTGVAELVKAEISKDAAAGVEIATILDGRITRKIVKQTVMTNVYGVTFTGAIRQVRKQVDDILPDLAASGQAGVAATYIARKIFTGLGTLFEGAHEIQYWLGDCAQRITHSISPAQIQQIVQQELGGSTDAEAEPRPERAGSRMKKRARQSKTVDAANFRSTVIWTTPLKLPVVQPYRVSHAQSVPTNLQNLSLVEPCVTDAVDSRKQLQGFPPNFVHSLDATHMMLSALKAKELGLTFSAVHDSFWTHAADINNLNALLRDAFIRMHSEDIIGRLAAEFQARYKGHLYLAKIGKHNELATKIAEYRAQTFPGANGTQQIRHRRHLELVREIQRMRLLASEDPHERAEGERMVTASSLFDQHDGKRFLPSKVSLGQTAIGEVPDVHPDSVADALNAEYVKDEVDLDRSYEALTPTDAEQSPGRRATDGPVSPHRRTNRQASKRDTSKDQIWLWLPLTFKDVPKKGEFDVRRLKDSTYFFS